VEKGFNWSVFWGILLGLMAGGLMEALLLSLPYMPSGMITGLIVLPTLIASLLGTMAGWPALVAVSFSCLRAAIAWGGSAAGLAVAEGILLPVWGIQWILNRRPRFFQGIAQSACLQFGALAVLVMSAWLLVRQDLVDVLLDYCRAVLERQPETPLMLNTMGQLGLFGRQTGLDFTRVLTRIQQSALLDKLYVLYKSELQLMLARIILYAGLLAGALSYWLSARILAKKGAEPPVSYAHPRDWFLPPHLILGPPACMLVCYLCWKMGLPGADAVFYAMEGLCMLVFTVQGIGAVDRLLFGRGASPRIRQAVLIVAAMVAQIVLALIGAASVLLGRKGLISTRIRKRSHQNKGGNGQ
jgi:hypothetical protein